MMFAGKRILVTGAATGIGRATAEHLVAQGAMVFGAGLDGEEGKALAARYAGDKFIFRETDLTREIEVRAAVAEAAERFGGLDAVVNCAGIYPTGKRLEELSDEDWDRTVAVNLTAIFRICRATLPLLRAAGGGSIVNIASVHADATVPGVPAYAATKAAVVGLSRQMALDYAVDRIRVNAVLVGSVATRMTLDGLEAAGGAEALGLSFEPNRIARIANPSEIATAIGFLISDASSFVTGSAMQVDGGLLARLL
ncbi:SDR family NAD(P)-dependent oxidoreductase [Mesorhizobium sp. VK25A]|uniref:SDR family NAD(P)-dependent oxidoreductase n=1 Tax=Mesorhizobium vachelliae TaxID=3072309 RepID=A0ABU5ABS7_9HYPH|nr:MULTISPECIES: SDR family NAD(P)-dependent oxidoreductase [unclassified Mesorhizobium]MDX8534992.1 SDR family NAD(P)-dependent oxidoreductase [Mesorhizobium sp. VK25D]MDX8547636.1 SDR family NAD(P)-dependent oxidoreductase [Mesorhizobium sp. VK25A]